MIEFIPFYPPQDPAPRIEITEIWQFENNPETDKRCDLILHYPGLLILEHIRRPWYETDEQVLEEVDRRLALRGLSRDDTHA